MPVRDKDADALAEFERQLEQCEGADSEKQNILNAMGDLHTSHGRHRAALRAHREEKKACQRLLHRKGTKRSVLLDLSVAYLKCGEATARVDEIVVDGGKRVTDRGAIARQAHFQHGRALAVAGKARAEGVRNAGAAEQRALAAMSQSAFGMAQVSQDKKDYERVVALSERAFIVADKLSDEEAGGKMGKSEMMRSAVINGAIALSGMGEKMAAWDLFERIAVRATEDRDWKNLMRALANLAEEAGDNSDWKLCLEYVDEWIIVAGKCKDEGEEAEGLRKRGASLTRLEMWDEARKALNRAALIGRDETAREDARQLLAMLDAVEKEIKEAKACLISKKRKAVKAESEGNFLAEANARIGAGWAAKVLDNDVEAVEQLSRYFVLVDDYACDQTATGIKSKAHNDAVTCLAESFAKLKKPREAVKWARRELDCFDGDIAGQAQAWCNIGNYLDDDGKLEGAREALAKSIDLAIQAGDKNLIELAQNTLQIVNENEAGHAAEAAKNAAEAAKNAEADVPDVMVIDSEGSGRSDGCHFVEENSAFPRGAAATVATRVSGGEDGRHAAENLNRTGSCQPNLVRSVAGDHSIVIASDDSGRDVLRGGSHSVTGDATSRVTGGGQRRTAASASRSGVVRGGAVVCPRYIDLVARFKELCASLSPRDSGVELGTRAGLVAALRSLSTSLVTYATGDCVLVDLSSTFICDDEIQPLLETLTVLPVDEPLMSLNFELNPLLTTASVRWLASSLTGNHLSRPLSSLVALDLSGTGIDAACLPMLARALSPTGNLHRVSSLAIGKNALGTASAAASEGVSRLLVQESNLETLDLSLNLFSFSFLTSLVASLQRTANESLSSAVVSKVTKLDLRLNNRREPTALLESAIDSAPADLIRSIVAVLPSLREIDLRACGAAAPTRRHLHELRAELQKNTSFVSAHSGMAGESVDIVVVSSNCSDPEDVGPG